MTKNILLALALTLGTATVAIPQASACGGYGPVEPAESPAIRSAASAFAARHVAADRLMRVDVLNVDGSRATAEIHFRNRHGDRVTRTATLELRRGSWRVVAIG